MDDVQVCVYLDSVTIDSINSIERSERNNLYNLLRTRIGTFFNNQIYVLSIEANTLPLYFFSNSLWFVGAISFRKEFNNFYSAILHASITYTHGRTDWAAIEILAHRTTAVLKNERYAGLDHIMYDKPNFPLVTIEVTLTNEVTKK